MDRTTTFVMTKERTWILTGVSVALFVLLSWLFADGLLAPPLWNSEDWVLSPLLTYLGILAIIAAGWMQANRLPASGIALRLTDRPLTVGQINDPALWRLLLGNIYLAIFWLPLRFFVGRDWVSAGLHKVVDPAWTGTGEALQGYWERAVAIPETGSPRIVQEYSWFRDFLQYMLDNGWYTWFAKVIAWGEVLVGVGLIVGAFVGLAAFFGTLMNFNFMLAGSASTNPVLFGLGVFLVLAWKVAGHWGLDRWLLPALGTPWQRAEEQVDSVAALAAREAQGSGVAGMP